MATKAKPWVINDGGTLQSGETKLIVWADSGLGSILSDLEGISHILSSGKNCYEVYIDPRYDKGEVRREIVEICERKSNDTQNAK